MTIHDPGKLAVLLVCLVGGFVLIIGGTEPTAGVGIVTAVLGYVTGNGVLAARKRPPSPAIVPTLARPEEAADRAELVEALKALARAQRVNDASGGR